MERFPKVIACLRLLVEPVIISRFVVVPLDMLEAASRALNVLTSDGVKATLQSKRLAAIPVHVQSNKKHGKQSTRHIYDVAEQQNV